MLWISVCTPMCAYVLSLLSRVSCSTTAEVQGLFIVEIFFLVILFC